jgi:hypothetical protein
MLTEYQKGSIFGAVMVALAFAFSFFTSPQPKISQTAPGNQTAGDVSGDHQADKSLWDRVVSDPMNVLTLGLLFVGSTQAILFLWQLNLIREGLADTKEAADGAKKSADIANESLLLSKETAERQLRAYVSLKQFGKSPMLDTKTNALLGWSLNVVWQNTGATPTRDMLSHTSVRFEIEDIPEDYRFPDMWIIGKEQVYTPVTLAPNSTFVDDIGAFSIDQLQEIRSGQKILYLYGWTD